MKNFTLLMVVAMATIGSVSAQNYNYNQRGNNRQQSVIASRNYADADRRTDDRFANNQRSAERYGNDNHNGYNDRYDNDRYENNRYATNDQYENNRFERNNRRDDRRYDNDRRYNDRDGYNRMYQQSHRRF